MHLMINLVLGEDEDGVGTLWGSECHEGQGNFTALWGGLWL